MSKIGWPCCAPSVRAFVNDFHNLGGGYIIVGLIEYTVPHKPNSRLQKYRITQKGRERLASAQKQESRE
jgi:hypothetical protein